MNSVVSNASSSAYRIIAKPILFKQKPDAVHTSLLKVGSYIQKSAAMRGVLHSTMAYSNEAVLGQTLNGIYFSNPVGLSAGFDKNFELVPLLKSVGFGFMEGGSLTYHECAGNPRPWFYRLPNTKSIVVHAGLANQGVTPIVDRIRNYAPSVIENFPLNISVAKTNSPEAATDIEAINDYVGSLQAIKKKNVGRMVTLNISCPNTYGGEPFTTPDRLEQLLAAVDIAEMEVPIFIKMPAHLPWERFKLLVDIATTHKISGLTISNLAKDRRIAKIADPLPDIVKGGLSGKPTWDLSNELIRKTRAQYGSRFTIIGVGGIFSAEDAYTKIKLGANLVELITGMIFEGPQLVGQINQGLARLLERDGYNNIAEATATAIK